MKEHRKSVLVGGNTVNHGGPDPDLSGQRSLPAADSRISVFLYPGISFLVAGLAAVALTTAGCAHAGPESAGVQSAYGMAMACDIFAKGGPVMWPLLACSLISLAITIERILFWWRERRTRLRTALIDQMFHHTERGEFDQAVSLGQGRGDATLRVLVSGLKHRDYAITESMMVAASDEIARMKHGLSVLDTIITMAPMLGILGTVTGIMRSFNLLGASDTMSPSAVASGIAEALITTAAGLVIALPTLVPFNALVSKVQTETRRLEQVMSQFETAYKKGLEHASGNRLRK